MNLTKDNINLVADKIRERLAGNIFIIASAHRVDYPDTRIEVMAGCTVKADWTDGNEEPIRVFDDNTLSFSAGHYLWLFHPRDEVEFDFDSNGFEVTFRAPCGDRHRHLFKIYKQIPI